MSSPEVIVIWRDTSTCEADRVQAARGIVETITGEFQRRPETGTPAAARVVMSASAAKLSQAAFPIGYREKAEVVAGFEWVGVDKIRLLNEDGEPIEPDSSVEWRARSTVQRMARQPRKPAKINVRPGIGGRPRVPGVARDSLEGLEQYGKVSVRAVGCGGASIAIIEGDPEGNAVMIVRNSSSEDDETMLGQTEPCFALVARNAEKLRIRYVIVGMEMKGTWPVRFLDSPPLASNVPQRDDILVIDSWIREGWLEHVVIRDMRRLARNAVESGTILRHFERSGVGTWLADQGRQVDYVNDRLMLGIFNVISEEDRDHTTRGLQAAKLNQGPLLGKGWGHLPFGFYRGRDGWPRQDMQQWPWILRMFELADIYGAEDGEVSHTKIQKQLSAEGFEISRSQLGKLLGKMIYVTGEYSVMVRGTLVAQNPIDLINPVALDRSLRIREFAALRKGRSDLTALGECLLNAVEAVHKRCEGVRAKGDLPVTIKAYRPAKQPDFPGSKLTYRHQATPECCKTGGRNREKRFAWNRDFLERPIVEAIRDLASDPEVHRQAALAARHEAATTSSRLDEQQRAQIEAEIAALGEQQQALAEEWVTTMTTRGKPDLAGYNQLTEAARQRAARLQTRLDNDAARAADPTTPDGSDHLKRVNTFLEIMSIDTPDDPFHRQIRARLFQRIVQRVVIDDEGTGPITVTIEGALIPEDTADQFTNPVLMAADLLDQYATAKAGNLPPAPLSSESQTVSKVATFETVSDLYGELLCMPSSQTVHRAFQHSLDYEGWRARAEHRRATGRTSWFLTVVLDVAEISPEPGRVGKVALAALEKLGGSATLREWNGELGWDPVRLDRIARHLVAAGFVRHVNSDGPPWVFVVVPDARTGE